MEVRFAFDTNRLTDFLRGEADAPVIVLGEMRAGFQAGGRAAANETRLAQFLDSRTAHPSDRPTPMASATDSSPANAARDPLSWPCWGE